MNLSREPTARTANTVFLTPPGKAMQQAFVMSHNSGFEELPLHHRLRPIHHRPKTLEAIALHRRRLRANSNRCRKVVLRLGIVKD